MHPCRIRQVMKLKALILSLALAFSVISAALAGSVTVLWDPNTEPDLAGYRVYYGTSSRNYSVMIDVGNVTSCQINNLTQGVRYFFAVTAYDTAGNESDFSEEVSTLILGDRTPPTVTCVQLLDSTRLELTFSEPVTKESAENVENYRINNGVQVLNALLDSTSTVVYLTTTPHTRGVTYIITISNILDKASNTIAPNSSYIYTFPTELMISNLTPSNYQTAYIRVGDRYYIDEDYTIVSIPDTLKGLLWIMTADRDKTSTGEVFLSFQVNLAVEVYVGYDSGIPTIPKWLDSWTPTGLSIVDSQGTVFDLFVRSLPQGEVTLGGNYGTGGGRMYIVLIGPLKEEKPPPVQLPRCFLLYQNYPNPFNLGTNIMFNLPEDCHVRLLIYDLLGRRVKELVKGNLQGGHLYSFHWDGRDERGSLAPSGTYFYQLQAGKFSQMKKMIFLR